MWVLDIRLEVEGQVHIAVTDYQQFSVSRPLKKGVCVKHQSSVYVNM